MIWDSHRGRIKKKHRKRLQTWLMLMRLACVAFSHYKKNDWPWRLFKVDKMFSLYCRGGGVRLISLIRSILLPNMIGLHWMWLTPTFKRAGHLSLRAFSMGSLPDEMPGWCLLLSLPRLLTSEGCRGIKKPNFFTLMLWVDRIQLIPFQIFLFKHYCLYIPLISPSFVLLFFH